MTAEPGDVAKVRNEHGVWNVAIRQVGFNRDQWVYGVARTVAPDDAPARELLVIDPEDDAQVDALAAALRQQIHQAGECNRDLCVRDCTRTALRSLLTPAEPEGPTAPLVHVVMYRDHKMGSLCNSGAWGTPELFTAVTENATCPGCRAKLDGGRSL